MYDGQIVQIGTPAELFEKPSHTFVGYFIGSPGMNVLPASRMAPRSGSANTRLPLPLRPQWRAALRSSSASARNSSGSAREGMPVTITKVEDIAATRWSGRNLPDKA